MENVHFYFPLFDHFYIDIYIFKYFYLSQINSFKAHILRYNQSLLCLFLLKQYSFLYQSQATARYALEMSPSKCCSSKGILPLSPLLCNVGALFAPILSFWWRFLPPLYDFAGAFCPHFLCSDFIVILFRFQISKNGGAKWSHF